MPLISIGLLAISAISTGWSIYAGSKAAAAEKKRLDELARVGEERLEYQPITQEELDAYTELVNAKADEGAAESRVTVANKAAAAGYDPEELLGQLEPQLMKQRDIFLTQTIAKVKAQDLLSERQFIMSEDLRLLENSMALLAQPGPEEIRAGRIAEVGAQIAEFGVEAAIRLWPARPAVAPTPPPEARPLMPEAPTPRVGPLTPRRQEELLRQRIQAPFTERFIGKIPQVGGR